MITGDWIILQGFWIPSGENKKIPVAIKVLKDGMGAVAAKDVMEVSK